MNYLVLAAVVVIAIVSAVILSRVLTGSSDTVTTPSTVTTPTTVTAATEKSLKNPDLVKVKAGKNETLMQTTGYIKVPMDIKFGETVLYTDIMIFENPKILPKMEKIDTGEKIYSNIYELSLLKSSSKYPGIKYETDKDFPIVQKVSSLTKNIVKKIVDIPLIGAFDTFDFQTGNTSGHDYVRTSEILIYEDESTKNVGLPSFNHIYCIDHEGDLFKLDASCLLPLSQDIPAMLFEVKKNRGHRAIRKMFFIYEYNIAAKDVAKYYYDLTSSLCSTKVGLITEDLKPHQDYMVHSVATFGPPGIMERGGNTCFVFELNFDLRVSAINKINTSLSIRANKTYRYNQGERALYKIYPNSFDEFGSDPIKPVKSLYVHDYGTKTDNILKDATEKHVNFRAKTVRTTPTFPYAIGNLYSIANHGRKRLFLKPVPTAKTFTDGGAAEKVPTIDKTAFTIEEINVTHGGGAIDTPARDALNKEGMFKPLVDYSHAGSIFSRSVIFGQKEASTFTLVADFVSKITVTNGNKSLTATLSTAAQRLDSLYLKDIPPLPYKEMKTTLDRVKSLTDIDSVFILSHREDFSELVSVPVNKHFMYYKHGHTTIKE